MKELLKTPAIVMYITNFLRRKQGSKVFIVQAHHTPITTIRKLELMTFYMYSSNDKCVLSSLRSVYCVRQISAKIQLYEKEADRLWQLAA